MRNNRELLLVHTSMAPIRSKARIDVMLTPQHYTLKREMIPLKYRHQAQKIAPSLFDGLLEEAEGYAYFVYKEEDAWVFIAYHPETIRSLLQSKGIRLEQVGKIFFAQQAKSKLETPLKLDEKYALSVVESVVSMVPLQCLSQEEHFTTLPKQCSASLGVTLKGAGGEEGILSLPKALGFVAIFLSFATMFIVEGHAYQKEEATQAKRVDALVETMPVLQSKLQRESIFKKYKTIDTQERKKRDSIKQLSKLIFKGVVLTEVSLSPTKVKATFVCDNTKTLQRLLDALKENPSFKLLEKKVDSVQVERVL